MKGWVLPDRHDANMAPVIQGGLEAEGIPTVLMNKQDSSYVGIATRPVEIWVPESHSKQANFGFKTPVVSGKSSNEWVTRGLIKRCSWPW